MKLYKLSVSFLSGDGWRFIEANNSQEATDSYLKIIKRSFKNLSEKDILCELIREETDED